MNKFIQLTNPANYKPIHIAVNQIVSLEEHEAGACLINLTSQSHTVVQESIDIVLARVESANAYG